MRATLGAARDIALGLAPWVPGQSRYGVYSISADELTRAFGAELPGVQVEQVAAKLDSRGTTDRVRLQLVWNAAGQQAGLPTSLFAKGTATQVTQRVICSTFGLSEYEARFYDQIHPAVAEITMTPRLARFRSGGRYLVAFEDLSAIDGLVFFNAGQDAPAEHITALVDTMAYLHSRFWNSPRLATDLAWVQTYANRPGKAFAHKVLSMCAKKFLGQDRDLPDTVRRLTSFYLDNRAALDRAWEALPPTIVHGDTHLGNTYARPDGTAGLYDWQNLHRMNGLRDFAYTLTNSVPIELRRTMQDDLLRRYLDRLTEHGVDAPSFDEAFDTYRLLAIDGWISAFTTAAIGGMQDDVVELTLPRAITTLVELGTEQALREAAARHR